MKLPFEILNPAGLWTLTAIVPLVVLYILKIKRQRLRVPSTWLWAAAQRDLLAKSPFKRLTPQIPLFLQLLAIIALALALARPATRSSAIVGDHLAIIIDTSASMSALDASGKTRLDIAKSAAGDVIDALGPGSDAMVLDAGHDARIASPLERDRRRLKAAVDVLAAGDVEGDLASAVALAVDRLRQLGGQSRVIVFTDGALAQPDALSSVALPLEVVKVGSPIDNVAIVRVDVRGGRDKDLGVDQVQAFAMIVNYGAQPRDVFVTMREQNASDVLASRRVLVQPGERAPVVLTFHPAPGDIGQGLVIEVSPHDAMPADDVAYGRVPPGAGIPVVIAAAAGKRSLWVERALQSDPNVDLMAAKSADLGAGAVPAGALLVVDGLCPKVLPPGDVLIINPPPGPCLSATVGAKIEKPSITSWATEDQRFRFMTLDGVFLTEAHLIKVDSPRNELVHTREGTVVADVSTPGRTATLISFDVGESNWPFKASFVLFMRNVVELARAHRAHGVAGAGRAGEPIRLGVPYTVETVEVLMPGGAKQEAKARNGLAVIPSTLRAGVYHASWGAPSPGSVVFAVNLASERESDVAEKPLDVGASGATVTSADRVADAHTEWSWLLAVLALLLVIADVWYITRKPKLRSPTIPLRPKRPERSAA